MNNDLICKCGHTEKMHNNMTTIIGCTDKAAAGYSLYCSCLNFKPDNLKYLENLVKQDKATE